MSTTITQTLEKLSLVGQQGGSATEESSLPKLKSTPLVLAGTLDKFNKEQLTPAIGISFSDLNLKEILGLPETERDPLIRDLAITSQSPHPPRPLRIDSDVVVIVSQQGVAFFKAQNDLTPTDLAALGLLLGTAVGKPHDSTLHIHPTQKLSETGLPVGTISSQASPDGRQISFPQLDRSTLASSSWHTDVAFEPRPALYTILRMHSLPPTGGDTLWASAYRMYDLLSVPLRTMLEGLTAVHDAERFREQAKLNGFELRTEPRGSPFNAGDGQSSRYSSSLWRELISSLCSRNSLRSRASGHPNEPDDRMERTLRLADFYETDRWSELGRERCDSSVSFQTSTSVSWSVTSLLRYAVERVLIYPCGRCSYQVQVEHERCCDLG